MDQAAFERKLRQTLEGKAENTVIQPTIQCDKYIQALLRINSYGAHSAFDYNLKNRYEVLRVGNADRLIRKRKDKNEHEFKFLASLEEVFGIVKTAHEAIGHGGAMPSKESQKNSKGFGSKTSKQSWYPFKMPGRSYLMETSSKGAEEVAANLLDIFLTFGAPAILQSDNGREFVNAIIAELSVLWPELKLVTGRLRHPQNL
ncbi:SCAN domain-containing protein 3-like [Oratosquilla oratoria]|uniref:SCAN domain-containing protein 3-like n=1 Tax=Oratosquilla oratoria TaxID=337810 RepID=UPI003F777D3B